MGSGDLGNLPPENSDSAAPAGAPPPLEEKTLPEPIIPDSEAAIDLDIALDDKALDLPPPSSDRSIRRAFSSIYGGGGKREEPAEEPLAAGGDHHDPLGARAALHSLYFSGPVAPPSTRVQAELKNDPEEGEEKEEARAEAPAPAAEPPPTAAAEKPAKPAPKKPRKKTPQGKNAETAPPPEPELPMALFFEQARACAASFGAPQPPPKRH